MALNYHEMMGFVMTKDDLGKLGGNIALAGNIENGAHQLIARVYFADTDFSGAVYHARYLEFLERGRSDFLRCLDVHHTDLLTGEDAPLFWVVTHMGIDFKGSARIDDILHVGTRLAYVGGASCKMTQKITCNDNVLIKAEVTAALINEAGRPKRFPKIWIQKFEALLDNGK